MMQTNIISLCSCDLVMRRYGFPKIKLHHWILAIIQTPPLKPAFALKFATTIVFVRSCSKMQNVYVWLILVLKVVLCHCVIVFVSISGFVYAFVFVSVYVFVLFPVYVSDFYCCAVFVSVFVCVSGFVCSVVSVFIFGFLCRVMYGSISSCFCLCLCLCPCLGVSLVLSVWLWLSGCHCLTVYVCLVMLFLFFVFAFVSARQVVSVSVFSFVCRVVYVPFFCIVCWLCHWQCWSSNTQHSCNGYTHIAINCEHMIYIIPEQYFNMLHTNGRQPFFANTQHAIN